MSRFLSMAAAAVMLCAALAQASAQSIGYADAVDRLGASCAKDIDKFCKTVNLGTKPGRRVGGLSLYDFSTPNADQHARPGPRCGHSELREGYRTALLRCSGR